jgi:hypothetical protein
MHGAREIAASGSAGACAEFILRHQSGEGSWTDWALPPGPSDYWTTAYIGARLSGLPRPFRSRTGPAVRAAAHWLARQEGDGGGWGYNDKVGCDADSTANAILFLAREGFTVKARSYERLLGFQRPDGGFSTYPWDEGLGSWGGSHPDVSAVAAQALLPLLGSDSDVLRRATGYVVKQRDPAGIWNSFWWPSPLYATEASLSLLRATRTQVDLGQVCRTLLGMTPANAFESALLIGCLLHAADGPRSDRAEELADRLVAEQLPDGSWASTPILRVTDRDCTQPWECPDPGPVYADPRRLFTSATVLRSLGLVLARMETGDRRG